MENTQIRFESDYTQGAAPEIIECLVENNLEQNSGYGTDVHCESARRKIRTICNAAEDTPVHFLVGGTQTNLLAVTAALRPYQGIIASPSSHICGHETGAVEATGHKVLLIQSSDGKVYAEDVRKYCYMHWNNSDHEHDVQPGMVYISMPDENGLLYSLKELRAIRDVCNEYGMLFYLDGARLCYALAAEENDVTLPEIYRLTDAFYIGGTKAGTLFGEALIIRNRLMARDFRYMMKRSGGMLAKGWLLGLQFEALFTNDLYLKIAGHAVKQAARIKRAFRQIGCEFASECYTNQFFPIVDNDILQELGKKYVFYHWKDLGNGKSIIRVCTSWATRTEDVDGLIMTLEKWMKPEALPAGQSEAQGERAPRLFPNLAKPFKIGKVEVKNRFVVAPMTGSTMYRPEGGYNDQTINYFTMRAKGGFGLLVTNGLVTDYTVDTEPVVGTSILLNPENFKEAALKLTDNIHRYGAKIFAQLSMGFGRNHAQQAAPSAMPVYGTGELSRVLTTEQIKTKIQAVIEGAKLAFASGFDGVEIHSIHWGYLLDQLAMSYFNHRDDEYGGPLANRLRAAKEIVEGIKQACGADFPVSMRLGLQTFITGIMHGTLDGKGEVGRTLEEGIAIAKLLESYGYDMLSVDAGTYDSFYHAAPPSYMPKGGIVELAGKCKEAVNIPVSKGTTFHTT